MIAVAELQAKLHDQVEAAGFAVIPEVFSNSEMHELMDALYLAMRPRSRAGVRHALKHEPVRVLARDARILNIAREILGAVPIPFRATLFDKSLGANWLVVWHQDTALPLRQRVDLPGWGPWSTKAGINYAHAPASALEQIIAVRVHFDDSTPENGPLRVLPGSHKLGLLSDDEVHQFAEGAKPFECVVPCGGVIAMRPLMIHASSKSQSDVPRRVLHIEYAASLCVADRLELAIA